METPGRNRRLSVPLALAVAASLLLAGCESTPPVKRPRTLTKKEIATKWEAARAQTLRSRLLQAMVNYHQQNGQWPANAAAFKAYLASADPEGQPRLNGLAEEMFGGVFDPELDSLRLRRLPDDRVWVQYFLAGKRGGLASFVVSPDGDGVKMEERAP